jgi:hypothetical protein
MWKATRIDIMPIRLIEEINSRFLAMADRELARNLASTVALIEMNVISMNPDLRE